MELEPLQCKYKKIIELHDVLYFPDISDTLFSIIENGHQPYCSFVIKNGDTTVWFPTFTVLAKTNKEITLDADLPFKDRHSHPDYINLLNDFNITTVSLIHYKSAIYTISTEDSVTYNLHCIEQASRKISTLTLQTTK